jgi:hypothetical protein
VASIHRATLLSFDVTTYTAMVLIEGADNEAQIPVSQWLPPALLVPNVEAAVVLFDSTNTDDGLLVAIYGSVGNWTLPALNLGAATGAAAGALSADLAADAVTTTVEQLLNSQLAAGHDVQIVLGKAYGSNTSAVLAYHHDTVAAARYLALYCYEQGPAPSLKLFGNGSVGLSGDVNLINGVLRAAGTQIAGARKTGWAAATNTKLRTTFDTTTVTLPLLAARVAALIDDLIAHGLIGA